MNILVINGSPKGKKSNTIKLTYAFLNGLDASHIHDVDIINVASQRIEPCRGCFGCWKTTPGTCVIRDDMADIIQKYINADMIIWSVPLYTYGVPSQTKALLDRLLPNYLPEIVINADRIIRHNDRYAAKQKHVLISTCGFCCLHNNYESLTRQFELLFGKRFVGILCPEGEIFNFPQLSKKTDKYLSAVQKAGEEYAQNGSFSKNTQQRLNKLFFLPEAFIQITNERWIQ
ncbi:flavodoxin family protein [Bacteroidia bacterium]|nr:flavodoxin family protein [Bacteroidia bacterium]